MLRSENGMVLTRFLYIIHTFHDIKTQKGQQIFSAVQSGRLQGSGLDTAHPFENLFPVFYLNGEPLNWFGLFFPSLTLKQFFVHQMFPPEVMKMKALPTFMEETHIIFPSPCKDHIRVTVNGVQKALQLSSDPIRIAMPVRIRFSIFGRDL